MNETHAIVFFLKFPEPGKVKTRLAAAVGSEHAMMIYRWMVETSWENAEGPWQRLLSVAPADKTEEFNQWLTPDFPAFAQVEGDLGKRIDNTVNMLFDRGFSKVLCVGGDCPTLDRELYAEAFRKLDIFDVCLSPATDGGYVMIGMNQPQPDLFNRIEWSTEYVMEQTLEAAGQTGLSVGTTRAFSDVDTIEDYELLRGQMVIPSSA